MGISSSIGSSVLTDQMIGTAYDNVREVATNIEYVKHVSAHLEQIYDVYENLETLETKLQWASVPGSASATGTVGQIAYEAGYLYICVDTDTWQRVALASW